MKKYATFKAIKKATKDTTQIKGFCPYCKKEVKLIAKDHKGRGLIICSVCDEELNID